MDGSNTEAPQGGLDISAQGTNPKTGIEKKIEQLLKEKLESGELVETPDVIYHFRFLADKRFLASPNKNKIKQLANLENTARVIKEVVRELNIEGQIKVIRLIPDEKNRGNIIPELGIGGRVSGRNEMTLSFSPDHPNVLENFAKHDQRQIAHELVHIARFQAGKKGSKLLDAIINDGLATYYQEHWKNNYEQTPWGHALTEKQLKEEWAKARDELDKILDHQKHGEWFFGTKNSHPRWSGYSLGNAIVESYFQHHPDTKMAEAARMESADILENSDFDVV